ncbi:kinesin-like protein KIF24 [Brachyistius frenatus]|uniref:kinesin-like protein KIF24 n=1 Tax=Brachyistius frenatus TaxID=100188 RepID=UPI0037E9A0DC
MTLCLYECLRAVELHRHYARFISAGVCRAAHLLTLSMEAYPLLGICTMVDRTRLFHLVQLVKTLDLESLGYDDGDDYDVDGGDEHHAVEDSSFSHDVCGNPDEDVSADEDENGAALSRLNETTFTKPSCVRRRLDFSNETIDHHQRLFSCPVDTAHVYANLNRNDESVQGNGSGKPVQLDSRSAMVCGCQGNKKYKPCFRSYLSDRYKVENIKPEITGGISLYNSDTILSSKCVSFPKPSPATVASGTFNNKPFGCKNRKGISRKQNLCTDMGSNGGIGRMVKQTPVYEAKREAGYNYGLPLSSPPAPNKKKAGEQRISVCVRKRPLTHTEHKRREADVVTTPGGECVIVHESKEAVDLTQYILQHRFYFDHVFGEESSNEEVYQRTAYPLVQHMLNGGKATCFAYGQTGAGKTHTMLGSSPGRPGLYALAVRDIFAHLSTAHTYSSLLVYVSFFEIYCGQLYDLLDHRKRLFAREDGQKVVHISGLRDVRVDSVSSLLEVISQGTEERTQGMSGVNPLSSRSHALLQIQLRDPNQRTVGRMWFVDLAGSERASDAKEPDRQSRMEGAEINQSLLALKECIRSLDKEQAHTPFRQSKLTQVLKDSFVGDSMTCMIANISPGHTATEHTLNTLRYANRVKELKGQSGPRGRRRGKTVPSTKHSLTNNSRSRSVGTRGKSPPKRPKLERQSETFGPTTPTNRSPIGGAILCSTPKNSKCGEETNARDRKGIGLEHVTPVRGWLRMGNKRHGSNEAGEREGKSIENETDGSPGFHSVSEQSVRAGLLLGQPVDQQLHLWESQKHGVANEGNSSFTVREPGFYHMEKDNPQRILKEERTEERQWIELRRQVETRRDKSSEVERERDFQKADERNKERERHLKSYHEQLQQFIPSSSSSSFHLSSTSTCPSLSTSTQDSLSSSVSPSSLQHSSRLSASAHMYHSLVDVLDACKARVEIRADGNRGKQPHPSGEIHLQTESSVVYSDNTDTSGDCGCVGEDWRVSLERTEARFEQERAESERRSVDATGEASVRRDDSRPTGMEAGERRWAWMAAKETEPANRMTRAIPANVEAQLSYSCDSKNRRELSVEGLDASDSAADGVWSAEQGGAADGLASAHSNSLFSYPSFDSALLKAPAERPLSPTCKRTKAFLTTDKLGNVSLELKHVKCNANILPLPLKNTSETLPSNSHTGKKLLSAAVNASGRQLSHAQSTTLPLTTSITQIGFKVPVEPLKKLPENPPYTQVHSHSDIKAKMSPLPQDETSADSHSNIMDPLSISLLQVDQQAATASFLQGENSNTSLCPLEKDRWEERKVCLTCAEMVGKVLEDEDVELRLSCLELPQAKTHQPTTSDTMRATNHSVHPGRNKLHIPEVMQGSLQDQEDSHKPKTKPAVGNKASASSPKPSTCASVQTSIMSPSVQHHGHTSSPSLRNLMTNATEILKEYAHDENKTRSRSIARAQSENVPGPLNAVPSRCYAVHWNHSSDSKMPPPKKNPAESNGQESISDDQILPTIHLFTLNDLDHAKWCIVEAHWEQLKEMEALCDKEGKLLCQQPDMIFGDYVHKLEEIMERKAWCVHSMRAQLQQYLRHLQSNPPQEDKHDPVT